MTRLEENIMLMLNKYIQQIPTVNNPADILGLSQDSVSLKRMINDIEPFFSVFTNMTLSKKEDKGYYKYETDLLKRTFEEFKERYPELVEEVKVSYGRDI